MEGLNNHAINFSLSDCISRQKIKRQTVQKKVKTPEEKVKYWLKNLEEFYQNNPKFQIGLVQFGVPILRTEQYSYCLSPGIWLEDVQITRHPERGLNWVKASLQEKRNGMTMGKVYVRFKFSQTYYLEKLGNWVKATLLLDDDEWLQSEKVDNAFGFILKQEKGQVLENLDWRTIQYKGYQNIARVLKWKDKKGAVRFLICTASAGTILNLAEADVVIGEVCPGENKNFGSPVLRYQRTPLGLMRLQNL